MPGKAMWITWERHRRSLEIAAALGVECVVLLARGPYYLRTTVLALRTFWRLARTRPETLFVQNPSLVLAALACFLKPLLGYRLIVDRHSNFALRVDRVTRLERRLYHFLSGYSVRKAELTVVTNEALRRLVADLGGRGFVLEDRPPDLPLAVRRDLGPGAHFVFVSSFAPDEPLRELCAAAAMVGAEVTFHVTGRPKRASQAIVDGAPDNVTFTGFLAEPAYQRLLASADGIMVMTTMAETLVCGAYEAVAVGVPLVLSDHGVLRDHFHRGAVFTDHEPGRIAAAVRAVLRDRERLAREIGELRGEHERAWDARFAELREAIRELRPGPRT